MGVAGEPCRPRQRLERINEATSYTVLLVLIKGIRHRPLPHREFYDPASHRSPSLRYRLHPSGCDWEPDQGRPLAAPRPRFISSTTALWVERLPNRENGRGSHYAAWRNRGS